MVRLGLLFWEIFFEEKITITKEDIEEGDDKDEISSLFNALSRNVDPSRGLFIDISCLDLISNCLTLYLQAGAIDTAFRTKLYEDIVEPLIKSFESHLPCKRHQQPP